MLDNAYLFIFKIKNIKKYLFLNIFITNNEILNKILENIMIFIIYKYNYLKLPY